MSDCRFGVSPVNYPDPDPDAEAYKQTELMLLGHSNSVMTKI